MKPLHLPARWRVSLLLILPVTAPAAGLHGLPFKVNPEHIANHDLLAWSLLGVLSLTLALVGACFWGIYRQFRKVAPEQQLLEELKEQLRRQPAAAAPDGPAPAPPWEKPADWWKKPPVD